MNASTRRLILWISIFVAVAAGVATFVALRITKPESSFLGSINFASDTAGGLLTVFAAWFFTRGLGGLKPEFRKAYILICIGIVIYSVSEAQAAVIALTDGWWWMINGFGLMPYLLSVIFIFLGTRRFTQLLDVKTRWASIWLATSLALFLSAIMPFLHYAPKESDNFEVGVGAATALWDVIFYLFAAGAVWRVKNMIGPTYVRAMHRLYWALVAAATIAMHFIAVQFVVPVGNWYYNGEMTSAPIFISGLLMLAAGYSVAIFSSDKQARVTATKESKVRESQQLVESITYAASLASKPQDVDVILDDLRMITAKTQPGQALSAKNEEALVKIYGRVQDYLIEKDPLRVFTVESLRDKVEHGTGISPAAAAKLWPVKR